MTNPLTGAARVRADLHESARVKTALAEDLSEAIAAAADAVIEAYREGRKTLLFGNGGSATDAMHIAAEWTGKLGPDRPALPSIALPSNAAETTAIGNDYGFDHIFVRGIQAHGQPGDVAIGISTSGNSPNVLGGVEEARRLGLVTIGLTGRDGGKLADRVDHSLVVPSANTARIQEGHIAIGHAIATLVDAELFPETQQG